MKKSETNKNFTKITLYEKSAEKINVEIDFKQRKFKVEFGHKMYCSCTSNIREDRKTCWHIIWCLKKLANLSYTNDIVAQVELNQDEFNQVMYQMPDSFEHIYPELKTCLLPPAPVDYKEQIRSHPHYNTQHPWYVKIKTSVTPATCTGCLQPDAIKMNDLHIATKGLLYVKKNDKGVNTELRFCPKKECVQDIKSPYTNIRPLADPMKVQLDRSQEISVEHRANLQIEGFQIQGVHPVDLS